MSTMCGSPADHDGAKLLFLPRWSTTTDHIVEPSRYRAKRILTRNLTQRDRLLALEMTKQIRSIVLNETMHPRNQQQLLTG